MPEYRYSVYDAKGQALTGTLEAENEEICRRIIAQRGLYCISVTPASLASRSINLGGKPKLKGKELTVFCRQFAAMLSSGISVIKSLDILQSQADNNNTKAILKAVYDTVQRGQSLSASLKAQNGAFPDLLINMVETGEASGTLDKIMEKVADHYEKDMKTVNKVKSALTYPMVLGTLTIAIVIILMVFVVPTFIKMFEGSTLPLPTRILIGISNSLTHYWYVYIIVVSTVSLVWMNFLKSEGGRMKWDTWKTRMPVVGKLMVVIISARFARTLSTLMQSGVPMLRALEIASRILNNKFFEKNISLVREDIKRGMPLSVSLRKMEIFPVMLVSMISVGEESGAIDDVLQKTASFYDEQSDVAISRLVGLLEPVMLIIMAVIVGFVVVSIILPMYGMMNLVK